MRHCIAQFLIRSASAWHVLSLGQITGWMQVLVKYQCIRDMIILKNLSGNVGVEKISGKLFTSVIDVDNHYDPYLGALDNI